MLQLNGVSTYGECQQISDRNCYFVMHKVHPLIQECNSVVQLYWFIEGVPSRRLGGGMYRQWSFIVCRISTGSFSPFHSQV